MDPASLVGLLGLGGSAVVALWRIANSTGRYEAKTTTILSGISVMLKDHEDRLRELEKRA
ncbi:MAG: hypothetical protein VKM34_08200 [Cyanobacteriota bacterium]|nr:hypothetical protein [Cyanobacteriota bacterium]